MPYNEITGLAVLYANRDIVVVWGLLRSAAVQLERYVPPDADVHRLHRVYSVAIVVCLGRAPWQYTA